MGAVILWLLLIFAAAGITGIVFGIQILRDHSKNRTTAWSKRAGVLSIIIAALLSIAIAAIIILALSTDDDSEAGWNDYVDTGVMVEWNEKYESFTYEGEQYVALKLGYNELVFNQCSGFDLDFEFEEKPVFNIKSSEREEFLFGSSYVETMYQLESEEGTVLYISDGYECYCRKADVKKLREYYTDDLIKNYEMWLYCEDEESDEVYDIELSAKDIENLNQITKRDKISYEYNENMPEGWISSTSSDRILEVDVDIVFIDGKWYWNSFEPDFKKVIKGKDASFAYELPENIEEQLPHEFD